jgi:alkylated DNA repair dioxygenase AlkB
MPAEVTGLRILEEFVTADEETALLREVDQNPWPPDLHRRTQHYGYRYHYKGRRAGPEDYLGPLPEWLQRVGRRIAAHVAMAMPDQVIVNEYLPGQGIAPHIDLPDRFGPVVATISLGADIQIDFRAPSGEHAPLLVPRCSLLVLTDDARYIWKHSIAGRLTDPRFGLHRARRVSLTFRTVPTAR